MYATFNFLYIRFISIFRTLCHVASIIQPRNKREPETSLSLTLATAVKTVIRTWTVYALHIQVNQSYLYGREESYRASQMCFTAKRSMNI